MLTFRGVYYAPVVRDTYYAWGYTIDPEFFGASKNKFFTEETSEYYPSNINNYPDKKKFMNDWKAKKHHKLDFSEYNIGEINEIKKITSGSNLTEEIKELKKLYDEGVLTKEEFEKGKKMLLN